MSTIDIGIRISAKDQASKVVKSMAKNVEKETKRASKAFESLKRAAEVAAGVLLSQLANNAVKAATESFALAGEVDTLKRSFESMAEAAGETGLTLEKLRSATRGTVSDVDLLRAANQALALGLPTENLDRLFEAAMKLGHAMGIDTKQAVESLTTGIGRQSKQILDNLGVVFQASDAYEWYAQKIGVAADELTEAQKKQAWMAYAIEQVTERAKELGDNISETQLRQEQWNATIENTKASIGRLLSPLSAVAPALEGIMQVGGPLIGTMFPQLITSIGGVGAAVTKATGLLGSMASFMTGPLGLAIMGAVAAGYLLAKAWTEDWGGIRTFICETVIPAISNAISGFVETAGRVWDRFSKLLWAIKEVVLDPLVEAFRTAFDFIAGTFMDFVNTVAGWVDRIMAIVKPLIDFFNGLANTIGQAFNSWEQSNRDIYESTRELEQQLVGHSIWTDMIDKMVRQTEEGVSKIASTFKGLRAEAALPFEVKPSRTHPQVANINITINTGPITGEADVDMLYERLSRRIRSELRSQVYYTR